MEQWREVGPELANASEASSSMRLETHHRLREDAMSKCATPLSGSGNVKRQS